MYNSDRLKQLVEVQKQIDALTVQAKALKKDLQREMVSKGVSNTIYDGYSVDVVETERKTVKHSDFATYLLSNGLNGYVSVEYKPNMDIVEAGVIGGQIPKDIYDQYVKTSTSHTLKVKSV